MSKKILILILALPLVLLFTIFSVANIASIGVPINITGIEVHNGTKGVEYRYIDDWENVEINYTVYPTNAVNKKVKIFVDDEFSNLITIDQESGTIKEAPKVSGTYKIYVSTLDGGYTESFTLNAKYKNVRVQSVEVDEVKIEGTILTPKSELGGVKTFNANVGKVIDISSSSYPIDALNKTYSFISSDSSIVSVVQENKIGGSAKLKVMSSGQAEITVICYDGFETVSSKIEFDCYWSYEIPSEDDITNIVVLGLNDLYYENDIIDIKSLSLKVYTYNAVNTVSFNEVIIIEGQSQLNTTKIGINKFTLVYKSFRFEISYEVLDLYIIEIGLNENLKEKYKINEELSLVALVRFSNLRVDEIELADFTNYGINYEFFKDGIKLESLPNTYNVGNYSFKFEYENVKSRTYEYEVVEKKIDKYEVETSGFYYLNDPGLVIINVRYTDDIYVDEVLSLKLSDFYVSTGIIGSGTIQINLTELLGLTEAVESLLYDYEVTIDEESDDKIVDQTRTRLDFEFPKVFYTDNTLTIEDIMIGKYIIINYLAPYDKYSKSISLSANEITLLGFNTSELSNNTIQIFYNDDLVKEFTYQVKDREVLNIEITSGLSSSYVQDTFIDTNSINVKITYEGNIIKNLSLYLINSSLELKTDVPGNIGFNVIYENYSKTFSYNVSKKSIQNIVVTGIKNSYYYGELINTSSLSAKIYYFDGTSKTISANELEFSNLRTDVVGEVNATYYYDGKNYSLQKYTVVKIVFADATVIRTLGLYNFSFNVSINKQYLDSVGISNFSLSSSKENSRYNITIEKVNDSVYKVNVSMKTTKSNISLYLNELSTSIEVVNINIIDDVNDFEFGIDSPLYTEINKNSQLSAYAIYNELGVKTIIDFDLILFKWESNGKVMGNSKEINFNSNNEGEELIKLSITFAGKTKVLRKSIFILDPYESLSFVDSGKTYSVNSKTQILTIANKNGLGNKNTHYFELTEKLGGTIDPTRIKWISSNPNIASVDNNGVITIHQEGLISIFAIDKADLLLGKINEISETKTTKSLMKSGK